MVGRENKFGGKQKGELVFEQVEFEGVWSEETWTLVMADPHVNIKSNT